MFQFLKSLTDKENLQVKQNFLLPFQVIYVTLGSIYAYIYYTLGYNLAALGTLGCSIITTGLSIWGYKQKDILRYQQIANLNIGLYLLTLTITAYDTGGITSSAGFWLPSVVLLAIILVTLSNVVFWSIATLLTALLLTALELNNQEYFYTQLHKLPHSVTIMSVITLIATTASMIIIAEYLKEKKHKELQKLRKELEHSHILSEVGEVSAGIAHEINNPLQIIKGTVELIKRQHKDIDQQYLDKINSQIARTQQIIQGLKKLSRNGSHDPLEQVNIYKEIKELLTLHKNRFLTEEIKLNLASPTQHLSAPYRPVQLNQIITNLINNAYDYLLTQPIDERWIKIDFKLDKDTLNIIIQNGGEKISTEQANKIFTPFYTTKAVNKGTGLGLSLSRSLAQHNGGNLKLDLQANYTTFILSVPWLNE